MKLFGIELSHPVANLLQRVEDHYGEKISEKTAHDLHPTNYGEVNG